MLPRFLPDSNDPGFAIDENINELGKNLRLPIQYEKNRKDIERILPKLD